MKNFSIKIILSCLLWGSLTTASASIVFHVPNFDDYGSHFIKADYEEAIWVDYDLLSSDIQNIDVASWVRYIDQDACIYSLIQVYFSTSNCPYRDGPF